MRLHGYGTRQGTTFGCDKSGIPVCVFRVLNSSDYEVIFKSSRVWLMYVLMILIRFIRMARLRWDLISTKILLTFVTMNNHCSVLVGIRLTA